MIDLRRDTTTRPEDQMRTRAFQAVLGDSVYGEDPAQNELAASILGKEAAIFLPSGTMGNLVAMLVHAGRGGEVILEENAREIVDRLARRRILATAAGTGTIRFVTSSVVDGDGIAAAVDAVRAILED